MLTDIYHSSSSHHLLTKCLLFPQTTSHVVLCKDPCGPSGKIMVHGWEILLSLMFSLHFPQCHCEVLIVGSTLWKPCLAFGSLSITFGNILWRNVAKSLHIILRLEFDNYMVRRFSHLLGGLPALVVKQLKRFSLKSEDYLSEMLLGIFPKLGSATSFFFFSFYTNLLMTEKLWRL